MYHKTQVFFDRNIFLYDYIRKWYNAVSYRRHVIQNNLFACAKNNKQDKLTLLDIIYDVYNEQYQKYIYKIANKVL